MKQPRSIGGRTAATAISSGNNCYLFDERRPSVVTTVTVAYGLLMSLFEHNVQNSMGVAVCICFMV